MALITKIEELKIYNASANLGIKTATILPSFNHVERTVIIPELGQALFSVLETEYQNFVSPPNTLMSATMTALLAEVRKVLAPLAILHYKNAVIQQMSDAGAVEKATENGSPARLWVNNLQSETLYTEGMKALDLLLSFLEENKADYPDWVAGAGYTQFREFLLQTTKEFDDEVKIGDSRKFFRALRPDIKYVENMILVKHIGQEFYDRLLTGKKDGDLTADEKIALKKIYPVVANYAIANSSLTIEHGNDGTYTVFSQSEYSGKNSKQPPSEGAVRELKKTHERRAQQYLNDLLIYLNEECSVAVFSEYYNSDYYTSPNTEAPEDINDTLEKTFSF